MSKLAGELSYKDWMIIKHALEQKVGINQSVMNTVNKAIKGLECTADKYDKFKQELKEEKATLERVTKLTDNFKDYIEGKEKHYMHRPNDCD